MPKLLATEFVGNGNQMQSTITGSSFSFSAVKPDKLDSTEYTLVTIVVDITGSVYGFEDELKRMVQYCVRACQKNSRSENIMVRIIHFNTNIYEIHGFIPVSGIDADAYEDINPGGITALYDASVNGIGATADYGRVLTDQDFTVNAAVYIITDGGDNASTHGPGDVMKALKACRTDEVLESVVSVLIGVNSAGCKSYLDAFKQDAGLDSLILTNDASESTLGKLANIISQSISSQSQALGTGGGSVAPASLSF